MAVNQYFSATSHSASEQDLVEGLIIESIQMKGVDVKYLIRDMINRDYLFGESTLSDFKDATTIEMYLESIDNYNGDGDIYSKFGMEMIEAAVWQVSAKRFREEFSDTELDRPREGDLIFNPISDALYEIKKVKLDDRYQQLGKNYTYRLSCKLFQYSHETIVTGEPEVDKFEELSLDLNDNGLRDSLGISTFSEESTLIEDEVNTIKTFDPSNPFA